MYKAPLTANVVSTFLSSFQSLPHHDSPDIPSEPFVYVDQHGVKLVTNMVSAETSAEGAIFALSIAEDGWMEMLALYDNAS